MTTVQLVIVCSTVLAVAGIAAWLTLTLIKDATTTRIVLADKEFAAMLEERSAARKQEDSDSLVGRAVLINTVGKTAVRGVVHADLPDRITLRDAAVLAVGTDAEAPAGGLLHVMRERIDLVQDIPAPPAGGSRGQAGG